MNLTSESRVNILSVGTALVVALVRHGIDSNRAPWDLGTALGSLLIHTIAVFLIVVFASVAIARWHRAFLGEDADILSRRVEFQYYITMTLLIATVAIFIVKAAAGSGESDEF
jgi:hypothetical protein